MDISALSQIVGSAGSSLVGTQQTAGASAAGGTSMFSDIYNNLISNVNQTDSSLHADIVKSAAGQLDNPQQLLIDSSKASIALQLVSSVRNDALQAYGDITKMQV
jgi:flagellar hook-basal body complex protein FliE